MSTSGAGVSAPVVVYIPPTQTPQPTIPEMTILSGDNAEFTVVAEGNGTVIGHVTLDDGARRFLIDSDEQSAGAQITLRNQPALRKLVQVAFSTFAYDEVEQGLAARFHISDSDVIVDIRLRDSEGNEITELTSGATVCLPLSAPKANEQPLLLHYDAKDGWVELPDAEVRSENGVTLVCGETMRLSLFALGYALPDAPSQSAENTGPAADESSIKVEAAAEPKAAERKGVEPKAAGPGAKQKAEAAAPETAAAPKQADKQASGASVPEPSAAPKQADKRASEVRVSDAVSAPAAASQPDISPDADAPAALSESEDAGGGRAMLMVLLAIAGALIIGAVPYLYWRRR